MFQNFLKKRIYLDHSATTPTDPKVVKVIKRYLSRRYANPSSVHESGLIAKASVELARESIARDLKCRAEQITFTGSGTESNNLAIQGLVGNNPSGKHLITSMIEHSSILKTVEALKESGLQVSYVDVNRYGQYNLTHLEKLIEPHTSSIVLSYVNSEIGTIQDIKALLKLANKHHIHLHLDAVQALPYLDMDLNQLGADSVSFSGHKIHAPKGIGLLYLQNSNQLRPILFGGGQESDLRGGTENVPYIMGLAEAIRRNQSEKNQHYVKVHKLQNYLIQSVLENIPEVQLTGHPTLRSPHHASFCFKDIDGKLLVDHLSQQGYETSSGTACSSKRRGPSKVIESCGIDEAFQMGSLRVSMSSMNTQRQIRDFVKALESSVNHLRMTQDSSSRETTLLSQDGFQQLLSKNSSIQVINVSPVAVHIAALPKMIHGPFWKLQRIAKPLDRQITTVLICQHGDIMAPKSAKILSKLGFKDVRVLQGGFFALQNV